MMLLGEGMGRTKRRRMQKLTKKDPRWEVPQPKRGVDICYLLADDKDRRPVASMAFDADDIIRNEWCPHRKKCLTEAAQHDEGVKRPPIRGMSTWACSETCPHFHDVDDDIERADPWRKRGQRTEPSTCEGALVLRPVPETAYAVLQAMARQYAWEQNNEH